ncbi:MAG: hypothetical protein K8G79_06220 [bacterium]|uniref:Uncharacterized protein n=1 Tax=Candidatus Methylomirabilis tolerans TaxID=3123416 RepID=A0AAJ1AHR8_9BACT|nr:hypothetical protein [Candidatus Methylomirabilis sp.]
MKKFSLVLGMVVAMGMAVGLPGAVTAASSPRLDAPTDVLCNFNNTETPTIDWTDLIGANKYAVEVIAGYDTTDPTDDVVDITLTFSFGTGDATSALNLPFSALAWDHDGDSGAVTPAIDPIEVDVQVKGLNPVSGTGGNKSQNNPFSDLVNCTLPEDPA